MKIYIAANYERHGELQEYIKWLEERGDKVVARWCTTTPYTPTDDGAITSNPEGTAAIACATEDLWDIMDADVLIQFTTGEKVRGGRHVELGFAMGKKVYGPGMRIVVIGPREHVFHWLPDIEYYRDWYAFTNVWQYHSA